AMVRPDTVDILDTTLRDGLQIEKAIVLTETKVAMAEHHNASPLRLLKVGAIDNPKKGAHVADTDQLLRRLHPHYPYGPDFFTREVNLKGAQRADDAGAKSIKLVLPASEGHPQANSDASIAEASERLMDAANFARDQGLRFDITTAVSFICPFDGITEPDHLV